MKSAAKLPDNLCLRRPSGKVDVLPGVDLVVVQLPRDRRFPRLRPLAIAYVSAETSVETLVEHPWEMSFDSTFAEATEVFLSRYDSSGAPHRNYSSVLKRLRETIDEPRLRLRDLSSGELAH